MMKTPLSPRTSASPWAYAAMGALVWTFGTSPVDPPPGDQDLTITSTFTEQSDGQTISPGAVWLSVTGWSGWDSPASEPDPGTRTYDARLCEIEYYWDITGPEGAVFAAREGINLPSSPAVFRDCSKQRGPKVCFPLTAPGTYNWTLFAVEPVSGKTCTKTGSFTTVSEDSAFPTTRTICYSIDGTFTGAPAGAQQISTLAAMQTAISNAITAGDPFRILFRRSETYAGSNINFTWTSDFPNFRSGTYGTGADPVVERPFATSLFNFPSGGGSKHVWMGPLWWKGGWDAVNERGYALDSVRAFEADSANGTFVVYGVKQTGLSFGHVTPTQNGAHFAAINCEFTQYRLWSTLAGSDVGAIPTLAYIGTIQGCVPGTVGGNGGRTGTGEWIAPLCNAADNPGGGGSGWIMRFSGDQDVIIQHCAHTQAMGAQENSQGFYQGCLRANAGNREGPLYNLAFNGWEGGGQGAITNSSTKPMNFIVDANLFFFQPGMQPAIDLRGSGAAIRNNHFFEFCGSGNIKYGVQFSNASVTAEGNDAAVRYYNNTFYAARNGMQRNNQSFDPGTLDWADQVVENNIAVQLGATGLDVTENLAGWTAQYPGRKVGFPLIPHVLSVSWAINADITISYPAGTNQAYWQALIGTDDFHMIRYGTGSGSVLYAVDGDFTVTFGASNITLRNTSASAISAQTIYIKLDRASQLTVDTSLATDAIGPVSWCKIAAGSEASFEISTGLRSYRDLENTVRGTPAYRGAIEA